MIYRITAREPRRRRPSIGRLVDMAGFERWRKSLPPRMQRRGEAAFASFVKKRTDAQLDRTVGTGPSLRMIFKGMERNFRREKTNGFVGDVQYELKAGPKIRQWVVSISTEGCRVGPGRSPKPAVTLKMTVPTG